MKEIYDACLAEGKIRRKNPDRRLASVMLEQANERIRFAQHQNPPPHNRAWTFIFGEYYEALRTLIDARLLLDGIHSDNHQCSNAAICHDYEYELNWSFLENMRKLRNEVNYRGRFLTKNDVDSINLELHFSKLRRELEKALQD